MQRLSEMYEQHLQPRADLQILANNGVTHTVEQLQALQSVLAAQNGPELYFPAFEETLFLEAMAESTMDPVAVKAIIYNKVLEEMELQPNPSTCPEVCIFKIIYGDIRYALAMMDQYAVFCKWRLEIG